MRKRSDGGPACPVTGRTVAEDLTLVVNELAMAPPHDLGLVPYSQAEWRSYCDGYYRALAAVAAGQDAQLLRRARRADWGSNGDRSDRAAIRARPTGPETRGGSGRARGVPSHVNGSGAEPRSESD